MKKIIQIIVGIVLISSCGPLPDIVSTDKKGNEPYSADEIRRITVDQPFLISGDYFRERNQEDIKPIHQLFSKSEPKPSEKLSSSVQPTQKDSQQPPPVTLPMMPLKIGFLIDQKQIVRSIADRITQMIPMAAASFPVYIVEGDQIQESLSQTDCLQKKDLLCVSKTIGLFPGIRMLILIEQFSIPTNFPGQASTQISVVDTGLAYRYPMMEISAQIQDVSESDTFIRGTLQSVIDFTMKKSRIMTPFCRSFSHEKDLWYITAGKQSGLKQGDILQIMSPGNMVKSPAGLPAGWISGKIKGKLRVEQFFGDDFAACSLVEGEKPQPDDLIVASQ